MKISLVHSISVAKQYSTMMVVRVAAIFVFRIFSTGVTEAYLRSPKKLYRDIFIT